MLVKLAAIFFSMILVNNYVLVKFYGILVVGGQVLSL